jgi:hypothetical protein
MYQENEMKSFDKIPQNQLHHLPPMGVLEELNSFIRIGDLFALNQYLIEFIRLSPEYEPFAQHVLLLSKEFRVGAIKKLLNQSMEKQNCYE